MRSISLAIDKIATLLALLGGVGIIFMLVHIVLDVIWRQAFNIALPATVELVSRYYMVAAAFFPLAWIERNRGMISVEIVTGMMPAKMLYVSDLIVLLGSCVIYAALAYAALEAAMPQYARNAFILSQQTAIPVWITYFFLPVSFALAALVTAVRFITLIIDPASAAKPATDSAPDY